MTAPLLAADPAKLAVRLRERAALGPRTLIGLCGAPGAGKSTLAARLVVALDAIRPGCAAVVGMDGFHLAASVIAGDGRRDRRGAPDTFDPHGYAALLRRLRANTEPVVYAPEYRREIEDPVGWAAARAQLDEVWYLVAPDENLRVARLMARHERFGKSAEHARRHVLTSDEPNADLVARHRDGADLVLRWPSW